MSKPDWCPQGIWDKSRDPALNAFIATDTTEAHRIIARALQTAKAEAYEEAAKWVVDNGWMSASDAAAIRKLGSE